MASRQAQQFDTSSTAENYHEEQETTTTPSSKKIGRPRKCTNCKVPHLQHHFGVPGPHCDGPSSRAETSSSPAASPSLNTTVTQQEKSQRRTPPRLTSATQHQNETEEVDLTSLHARIRELQREEEEVFSSIKEQEQQLLSEIAQRERHLSMLRRTCSKTSRSQTSRTAHQNSTTDEVAPTHLTQQPPLFEVDSQPAALRQISIMAPRNHPVPDHNNVSLFPAPLQQQQQHQQQQQKQQLQSKMSEVFLRPTRNVDNGMGKPLRIVDFVSRLCPTEEEKVISGDSQTKLTLSVSSNKPKLESISVEQYSIANLRIFYELLYSNRLSTMQDVQEYLSYSIKLMELAKRYTWLSVLRYDDEYRVLQHTYGFSWSTDNSHLHEVVLLPRWAANYNTLRKGSAINSSESFTGGNVKKLFTITHLAGGQEICRSFNSSRGCFREACKFAHVCNQKVGSQACGKPHAGCNHSLGHPPQHGPSSSQSHN